MPILFRMLLLHGIFSIYLLCVYSISSVQSLSRVWLFATHGLQHTGLTCPSPTPRACLHWLGDIIQSSHPLSSPSPPALILPSIMVFSKESVLRIRWRKYWGFSFSIRPSNEYSGLISFRIDWLDLLAVQGTLKSSPTPQFKSINSLTLSFFMVQLSHPYMTTGKTRALTRWTFVGKVMSPLFNMLSSLVIAFLPRSKDLLISWLQSLSAVILEPPKKSVTVSIVSPSIWREMMV